MARTPEHSPRVAAPLSLRGVWKIYAATTALRDVSITASPGRTLALLGPNGAGKSTVLRIASGLIRPTRGTVHVAGDHPAHDGVRRLIGFSGHRTFLYGALTAEENLRFYAELYRVPPERVDAALDRFALSAVRRRRAGELSRGLTQRLSLARALLHEPPIVLLDEPFTGLDAPTAEGLAAAIARLRQEGRTVVLATHEWESAREVADDAVVLVGGRVAHRAPAAALQRTELPALYAGAARS